MAFNCNAVTAVVFMTAMCSAHAFFFGRDNAVASSQGREVEESCLAKADEGSCEFYSCFERRLPCGRDWYILRQGLFYCNRIEGRLESFPEDAQVFLRDSQKCLMQALKDSYREDSVDCHDLEHLAVDAISSCYIDNAFCSALRGNFAQFFSLYEVGDLFSSGAGKVWREIASLATQCGGDAIEDLTSAAGNTISETMDNVVDTVGDRLSSIFDFKKK